MKHTQKTKAKHAGAKKLAATAPTSTRRATVTTKPRRKQSVSVKRKVLDQIPVIPILPVSVKEPEPIMSHLFWPALPFAMMRMWWGTGASKGT